MIDDTLQLIGATHGGSPLKFYDDGSGPIFILRNSMGILGLVRADTWEFAYEISEDELFQDADDDVEYFQKEYGFRVTYERKEGGAWETIKTPDPDAWADNPCWQENYGVRPNGPNKVGGSLFYQKDLNGESLDRLTSDLASELGITIETQPWE